MASQNNVRLKAIDQAVINLKRGKHKLTVSKIAEKANIARKTIYNNVELKQRCDQAINIQKQENNVHQEERLTGIELLKHKNSKLDESLNMEKEKNQKLLENNRQLILEKEQLKAKIQVLQSKVERISEQKVKPFK